MVKRKRIGVIFSYNEAWIAGSYYILNIINALHRLEYKEKPVIVVLTEQKSDFLILEEETQYPFLEFFKIPLQLPRYSVFERLINKIGRVFKIKKLINKKPLKADIEFLYPFEMPGVSVNPIKKINWVPDFQEIHLPNLFTEELLEQRKKHQKEVICKGDWVVFSSKDAQKDFNQLYTNTTVKQYVLPFAVTHPDFKTLNLNEILKKYDLPKNYYFAPNQFWAHKNHMVVLEAVNELKDKNINIQVAFSGKENDHRNADYVSLLHSYVKNNNLEKNVHFLGFIPRKDQLKLMQNAVAIIQPSKFEGWSTVVEDAKAINQYLILSDIDVHKEQINKNVSFFNPTNYSKLAALLSEFWLSPPKVEVIDYDIEKSKFAKNFMSLITSVNNQV
ncbi:glycosyltransferase [Flavivirga algicola]|uniref:Glycosyltransferase family 4 protein n=1 Tax=Flavivirga algicola TaxID=2729136 RepID=A0ABX1RS24_9FLAO|nr:glycosyltransferase [Flavivirga algicola]NMH86356.1 glycosyltransferase family 4 protein [Flavivirga algicola]